MQCWSVHSRLGPCAPSKQEDEWRAIITSMIAFRTFFFFRGGLSNNTPAFFSPSLVALGGRFWSSPKINWVYPLNRRAGLTVWGVQSACISIQKPPRGHGFSNSPESRAVNRTLAMVHISTLGIPCMPQSMLTWRFDVVFSCTSVSSMILGEGGRETRSSSSEHINVGTNSAAW